MHKTTIKILFIALIPLLLSACVGAFLAGAATGGLIVYDRRSLAELAHDQTARHKIRYQFDHNKPFKGSHISVASFHDMILLSGQSPNPEIRLRAEQVAHEVAPTAKIFNQISISSPSSTLTRSSDAWITTKLKTEMLASKDLHSGQIKVVTENGVVYLMGRLTPKQANLATDIARKTGGVQKVVKIFAYENAQTV